ncbi:MAG: chromate efflux transporter [Actinomycetota bacterium]|nr:chromate efflux transporter [Actinomycetota bacterium]
MKGSRPLTEIALPFLKLGFIGFGGPAAHVALMRREFVVTRQWLDEDRFLELFGASNLIPGPSSTELGMMLGYLRGGWPGLFVAGACFIGPAMAIVLALAWLYVRAGSLPQTAWVLYGVKPVIIAIIADALWALGRRAAKTWFTVAVGVAVLVLYLFGTNILVLLFGGALLVMVIRNATRRWPRATGMAPFLSLTALPVAVGGATLGALFLEFVKIGAVVFGSGYVLLAFLRSDLVHHLHWLSQSQLVDAVAVGQVTPGPVFTTATFIGYLVDGFAGAVVATLAIFLPAFVLCGVVFGMLPKLRRSPWADAFLQGVTVCGLGLMAGVTIQLARVVLIDWFTVVLAAVGLFALRRYQPNSVWLVLAGAGIGLAVRALGS